MASTKKIIEAIDRLSVRDRRIVLKHLEQLKAKPSAGRRKAPTKPRPGKVHPYGALLDLAGRAHGEAADVSSDKYRHLATAYADTHDNQ